MNRSASASIRKTASWPMMPCGFGRAGRALHRHRATASDPAKTGRPVAGTPQQLDQATDLRRKQASLFDDELAGVRALAEQGYASMNRVRELERARAQLSGQNASLSADHASVGAQLGETNAVDVFGHR
jgi:hypothetical protein